MSSSWSSALWCRVCIPQALWLMKYHHSASGLLLYLDPTSDTGRKVKYCAKPGFPPPSASPSERDLFPCLSPASNPIANLPSRAEAQACGLSVCQAVNRLVMQDGLANYLYIIPQKTVRERLSFSQLPSSLLISRKRFYLQCPMKHGRTSLRSAEHLVICQEKDYLYLEDYL